AGEEGLDGGGPARRVDADLRAGNLRAPVVRGDLRPRDAGTVVGPVGEGTSEEPGREGGEPRGLAEDLHGAVAAAGEDVCDPERIAVLDLEEEMFGEIP